MAVGGVSSTGVVVLLVLSGIPGAMVVVLETQLRLWQVRDQVKGWCMKWDSTNQKDGHIDIDISAACVLLVRVSLA